jgi:hypothetical protein
MAALYADDSKHIILLAKETATKMEYVKHEGKNVSLLVMDKDKFLRSFSAITSKHTAQTIAQKYLDLAKTGVIITPAARHALQATLNTTSQEATMAVPTTLPKGNARDKKSAAPKTTKLSELAAGAAEAAETETAKPKRTAKPKAEVVEKTKRERKPKAEAAPWTDIVAEATAEAERIVAEADAKLEEAKLKAEEKKIGAAARAEAKKIIVAAKKHAAKIKTQIKKLSGRSARTADDEGEEKPKRVSKPRAAKAEAEEDGGDDISKMKIVQVNEPRVKEGSAAGARALAVYKSKSVKSALQYEGVTVGLINKMVENGFIELV